MTDDIDSILEKSDKMNNYQLRQYIERCIELAKKSPSGVRPVYVGALVVSKDGEVVGEGYKSIVDGTSLLIHAERMALNDAGDLAKNGTLVTTLEPCTRLRRNQIFNPCSELIVERGIETVVIGMLDTSSGFKDGIRYLEKNGINVIRYTKLNKTIREELIYGLKK